MSLRRRMLGLTAAAMSPLCALLAFDTYDGWRTLRHETERSALAQARQAAGTLSALLDGAGQLARSIALIVKEGALAPEACASYLKALADAEPRYFGIAILTVEGRARCSANPVPPDLVVADRAYFKAALESNELVVAEMVKGRVSARPSLPLAFAIRDSQGQVGGVVVLPLNLENLSQTLGREFSPERGFLAIVDRSGIVAAQVPYHAEHVGRPAAHAVQSGAERTFAILDIGGRPHISAMASVQGYSGALAVLVGLDREKALSPVRQALWRNLVIAGGIVALAVLAMWLTGRRLLQRPIRGLVDAARRQASGDLSIRYPEGPLNSEFGQLGRTLNSMSDQIRQLLDQKSLLIREVQHRVMNSLQLLGSFLHLQARNVDDEAVRKHLNEARERVVSMSVIYRHLYHADTTKLADLGEVLRALCEETARAYMGGETDEFRVDAELIELPVETVLSLALITHELVTNSLKHGYEPGARGPLVVELRRHEGRGELAVSDRGRGRTEDLAIERPRSLGMTVIKSLARHIGATMTVEPCHPGLKFVVSFPIASPSESRPMPARD